MALSHSPMIVTNGLIFYYDMANTRRSWRGAPTTNLQLPNIIDWSNNAIVTLMPFVTSPAGSPVYSVTDNNTASYMASSRSITVPNNSNTYTLSIFIAKTGGGTSARLGFNSGIIGGTTLVQLNQRFNSDTGVGNVGSTEDLGSWWRWQFQITNNSTGNTTLYCDFFPATGLYNAGDNPVATGTAVVSAVQIEQNTFATPFVAGTRSNTQALLDLTNNTTMTASSLTYASDNSFSFNYDSTNYITVPLALALNKTEGTMNFWVYPTRYSGGNGYFVNREDSTANALDWFWIGTYGDTFYFRIGDGSTCCNNDLTFSNVSTVVPVNTWVNMCFTWKANGTSAIYKNGVLLNSRSIGNIPATNPAANGRIGLGHSLGPSYFDGRIPAVQIYNRQFSANEVRQNFNALRGRYGL